MKRESISFETWLRNHRHHEARWCRELYPWEVFAKVDYSREALGVPQSIPHGDTTFQVRILRHSVGDDGRHTFLMRLRTDTFRDASAWGEKHWDEVFQLVADSDGYFITLFTKRDDPTSDILRDFMCGQFGKMPSMRSNPLSALLFRSILSYAAEEAFGALDRFKRFSPEDFAPFLSKERDVWIGYALFEDSAHKFAMRSFAGCSRAIVVYAQPTFSRHSRCSAPNLEVASLPAFLELASPAIRHQYMPQVRFLINHLIYDEVHAVPREMGELKARIVGDAEKEPISTALLHEAKMGLGLCIETIGDCAYFFACANLLNAALNEKLGTYSGSTQLRKDLYAFKETVGKAIERLIEAPVSGVSIYFKDDVAYVRVGDVQFSFRQVVARSSRIETIADYIASERNAPQEWTGIRLQPIAPTVLAWASAFARNCFSDAPGNSAVGST